MARKVADRQHLNSRRLRQWSNGSGPLTSSCLKINLNPPLPAISAVSVVIVLFIFIYFVHLSSLSPGMAGRSFEKFEKIPETIDSAARGRTSSLSNSGTKREGNASKESGHRSFQRKAFLNILGSEARRRPGGAISAYDVCGSSCRTCGVICTSDSKSSEVASKGPRRRQPSSAEQRDQFGSRSVYMPRPNVAA